MYLASPKPTLLIPPLAGEPWMTPAWHLTWMVWQWIGINPRALGSISLVNRTLKGSSVLDALVCPGRKGKEAEGACAELALPELLVGTHRGEELANPEPLCRAGDTPSPGLNVLTVTRALLPAGCSRKGRDAHAR